MAWRRPGDKPLSEPWMESLLTHISVYASLGLNELNRSGSQVDIHAIFIRVCPPSHIPLAYTISNLLIKIQPCFLYSTLPLYSQKQNVVTVTVLSPVSIWYSQTLQMTMMRSEWLIFSSKVIRKILGGPMANILWNNQSSPDPFTHIDKTKVKWTPF